MVNIFAKNPEISTQLSYVPNFPVNQSIAIRADNGWLVETASKSQQDKTIIMK
jgi:hypothetical protein